MNNPNRDELARAGLGLLRRDFVVIGKQRVRSFYGWLIIGVVAGAALAIGLVANQSGQFTSSEASVTLYGATLVKAAGISKNQIAVSWINQDGAEAYTAIERSGSENGTFVQIVQLPGGTTSYTDGGLYASTTYYYRLRTFKVMGRKIQYSPYSNTVRVATLSENPMPTPTPTPTPEPTSTPTPTPTPTPTSTTTGTAPTITSLSPASGPVGTVVTISGKEFGPAQGKVTFNGVVAATPSGWSNPLKATVPAGATTGPVVIKNAAGLVSNGVTFTVTVPAPAPSPSPTPTPTSTPTSTPAVTSADISIANNANNAAPLQGATVTYTLSAKDLGPASSTGVVVTDLVPAGVNYASYSATQGTYSPTTGAWNVGTLLPNTGATLTLNGNVAASSGQSVTNTASVSQSTSLSDPNIGNNTASASFTVATPAPVPQTTPPPPGPTTSGADNRYCLSGNIPNFGSTMDGPAALPKTCFYTAMSATPSPGKVWVVNNNTDMQAALAGYACGDTIQITAGVTLNGTWNLSKSCDSAHWITIESSGVTNPAFPPEGTRITPCAAGVASIPNRPSYPCNTPTNLMAKDVVGVAASGAFNFTSGASYYRLIGLELTRTASPGIVYNYVNIGAVPVPQNHIILDRIWIHGINQDGKWPITSNYTDSQRGIFTGQSNNVAVLDSYISDMYCTSVGLCSDAQAIAGGIGAMQNSGWGTYKIVNNHLEGAAEGILFGGANGPAISPAGCTPRVNCNIDVPSDAEVRRNLFFKPLSWVPPSGSSGAGYPVEKNGWEMKTGNRWLFEGNVIQNTWYDAQGGAAFALAPKNQGGGSPVVGTCWTCLTDNFTIRYDYHYNVAYGMGIWASQDMTCTTSCPSQGGSGISIHDNVIDNLHAVGSTGDDHEFTANTGSPLNNVSVVHNTISTAVRSFAIWGNQSNGLMNNWTYQNNIAANGQYGFEGMHLGSSACDNNLWTALAILNACVTPYTFDHNIVMGGTATGWPTGNFFPASSAVGFTNFNGGNGNMSPAGYQLLSTSPYHNAGSDGKDIGADIPGLVTAISGNQY